MLSKCLDEFCIRFYKYYLHSNLFDIDFILNSLDLLNGTLSMELLIDILNDLNVNHQLT